MNLFRFRYAICLLFILTQDLTFAKVENVQRQRKTPAQVFTNFLKVPWINLNSSWTDKVAPVCRDDITTLFESADAGEIWALQMLDASSKIPAGILTGNSRDLGMYDECIRVKAHDNTANIQGRHCMVSMSMPPKVIGDARVFLEIQKLAAYNPTAGADLNFASSVCLPSSCGVEDIAGIVNASIQSTPEFVEFGVEVAEVTCSSVSTMSDKFTVGTILAISFFAAIAVFLVFCTVCDLLVHVRSGDTSPALKTLAKFSLYMNAIKLFNTEISPGTMPALNGIKFFSLCQIVIAHRVLGTLVQVFINYSDLYEMRDSTIAIFSVTSVYAIDTFLTISGFLTAYLFLNHMRSGGKFNLFQFYLHRYLRLTPCVIALLVFVINIYPVIGSGPLWEGILKGTSDFCQKNWWSNLLYVQNVFNLDEMCMPHTWYLAAEMHLHWLCPIILFPLLRRPKLGLMILSIFLIASFITPAVYLLENHYSFLFAKSKTFQEKYWEFLNYNSLTQNRVLSYFVGILLGYYVVNNKRRLTEMQVAFNWTMASILLLFCWWNVSHLQPIAKDYSAGWEAISVSVGRLNWSLAMSWIIFACTQGYGGSVERFLSLPIFVPLSRLCYGTYLVSTVIQIGVNASIKTATYHSILGMIYLTLGDLVVSFAMAIVLSLCFETPVLVLVKILRTERRSEIIKHASAETQENLTTIIRQPRELTNVRGNFSSAIQARMLQQDFWRIVSDALHTLGKRSTKTPAEWVKTWQDWKSDLSENESKRKNGVIDVQDGLAEYKTGIITSEEDLLAFLATVSQGLDDVVSFERSEIEEDKSFELNSSGSENGEFVRLITSSSTHPRKRHVNL